MRISGAQDRLAALARRTNHGAGRQLVKATVAVRDEGIARIFARRDGRQDKALGHLHRHILHRMYGEIGTAFLHRDFELLDEQALAANLRQGAIKNLVALGRHAENLDLALWI